MNLISPSAKGVAYLRHLEVSVSKDTLAKYFCDEEGKKIAKKWLKLCPYTGRTVAIRGRYIDDTAAKYIKACGIKQLINIAAGLNTFPHRHQAARKLKAYTELDLPSMLKFKENVIGQLVNDNVIKPSLLTIKYVPIDLFSDMFPKDFRNINWDWNYPSIYIFEGMSYYLPFDVLQQIIDTFYHTMTQGSVLIMDYFPDYVQSNKELTTLLDDLPKIGAETCVTYLSESDVKKLFCSFTIVSDRLESDLEHEYYPDHISQPIGSIIMAEKK